MSGRVFRAEVTRATTAGVWVEAPRLFPGVELGPLPLLANVVRVGPLTTTGAVVGDHGSHTHTVAATRWLPDLVAAGDQVLVQELDTDDFVVLGVLRGGVTATGAAP